MQAMPSHFLEKPHTKLGWWSIRLGVIFLVMFVIDILVFSFSTNTEQWRQFILPFYASTMILCGLAGGVVGLIAEIRQHERSYLVWLAILIGAFVLLLVLNEIMQLVTFLLGV